MAPPSSSNAPAYKSHPLYRWRYWTIVLCAVGTILSTFSLPGLDEYQYPSFIFIYLSFLLSVAFCLYDLISWSLRSSRSNSNGSSARNHNLSSNAASLLDIHPAAASEEDGNDDKPKDPSWPYIRLLVGDVSLAILQVYNFGALLAIITPGYSCYYSPFRAVYLSWAALAALVAAFLHARAFWKEAIARKKKQWEEERSHGQRNKACGHCGYIEARLGTERQADEDTADTVRSLNQSVRDKLPQWIRKVSSRQKASAEEVPDVESGMSDHSNEASHLITPEESAGPSCSKGYGAFSHTSPVLDVPDERVTKKKGKTRVVEVGRENRA